MTTEWFLPYALLLGAVCCCMALSGAWASVVGVRRDRIAVPVESGRQPADLFFLASLMILVIFSGVRYSVGTDFILYYRTYVNEVDPHSLANSLAVSRFEPGFALLSYVLHQVSSDPRILFLACAVLVVALVAASYGAFGVDVRLALLFWVTFGYYFSSFNLVRQSLGASLALGAIAAFERRRRPLAAVLGIAAVSVHASAVVFLVAYVGVSRIRFTWPRVWLLLAGATVGASLLLASPAARGLVGLVEPDYVRYLEQSGAGLGVWLAALVRVVLLLVVCVALRGRVIERSLGTAIYMVVLGTAAWILSDTAQWLLRLDDYFGLFLPIMLVLVGRSLNQRSRTLYYGIVWVVALVYAGFYVANFSGLVPYRSWTDAISFPWGL